MAESRAARVMMISPKGKCGQVEESQLLESPVSRETIQGVWKATRRKRETSVD
jgi:hypothetical protein